MYSRLSAAQSLTWIMPCDTGESNLRAGQVFIPAAHHQLSDMSFEMQKVKLQIFNCSYFAFTLKTLFR